MDGNSEMQGSPVHYSWYQVSCMYCPTKPFLYNCLDANILSYTHFWLIVAARTHKLAMNNSGHLIFKTSLYGMIKAQSNFH